MKILIINFNLKGLEVDAFKAQAHIDAMDFRSVEGLKSKYFIGDENDNVYGGVYIFKDEDLILKDSETFFKYWMDAGANGGTVGQLRGSQNNWGFGIRFQSMKDYGKAQDKLDQDGVWANHKNFFDGITWHGFNLSRVLESNWD